MSRVRQLRENAKDRHTQPGRDPHAKAPDHNLERRAWPMLPAKRRPVTKAEREKILGYGPDGV